MRQRGVQVPGHASLLSGIPAHLQAPPLPPALRRLAPPPNYRPRPWCPAPSPSPGCASARTRLGASGFSAPCAPAYGGLSAVSLRWRPFPAGRGLWASQVSQSVGLKLGLILFYFSGGVKDEDCVIYREHPWAWPEP